MYDQPVMPEPVTPSPARTRRRWPKVVAGIGIATGTAAGAAALAAAASGTGGTAPQAVTTATSGSGDGSTSTVPSGGSSPATAPPKGPRGFGPMMAFGGPGMGPGRILHGTFTVQGPNGYEDLQEQTGTVSSITDTSGSTWTMTVTSADGTALTYTIDSGTSVDGGETGVSSISKGDTVHVLAVVTSGTATAKAVEDQTVQQSNGQSWMPSPPSGAPNTQSGTNTSA
ncbi:MAG TPA: hypothetical protein VE991_10370 [Acidimicrobiales bacterium]|nr:hypothetical protein [Acidimicrobiales bacterium]